MFFEKEDQGWTTTMNFIISNKEYFDGMHYHENSYVLEKDYN